MNIWLRRNGSLWLRHGALSLLTLVLAAGCQKGPAQSKANPDTKDPGSPDVAAVPTVTETVRDGAGNSVTVTATKPVAAVTELPKRNELRLRPFREWGVRETTIDSLARIGKPAVPALVEALHNNDPDVRAQAAQALARIGPDARSAVRDLIGAIDDKDERVRKTVIRAIGQVGPDAREAVPALVEALRDADMTPDEPPALPKAVRNQVEFSQPPAGAN